MLDEGGGEESGAGVGRNHSASSSEGEDCSVSVMAYI